jgi:hypothetical protein
MQGMRRPLRFTIEASPFWDTYKTTLGPHAQRDLVRSNSALVPDRIFAYPGSDGAFESGEQALVFVVLVATRNFLYPGIIIDKTTALSS